MKNDSEVHFIAQRYLLSIKHWQQVPWYLVLSFNRDQLNIKSEPRIGRYRSCLFLPIATHKKEESKIS